MKVISRILAVLAVALSFGFSAHANESLLLATGNVKEGSTYGIVGQELLAQCGRGQVTAQQTNGGGTTNRSLLLQNKVELAILPSDMLEFSKRRDPSSTKDVRTLIPLYEEEVHVIARADVQKKGGWLGTNYGATEFSYKDLADLAGKKIGAVGGSVDTASVLSATSGLNFQVERVNNTTQLLKDLQEGKYDAIVMVMGAPAEAVEKLPGSFKILPIGKAVQQRLIDSKIYSAAKLTYENLNAAGVDTVAARAVIATRTYEKPEVVKVLKEFRECFYSKMISIRDSRGSHAKWRSMDVNLKSGWQWYDLP